MEELFEGPTNLKGRARQDGTEKRKQVNGESLEGVWEKYKEGWFYVTAPLLYTWWAAKWGTSMMTKPLKDLFSEDYIQVKLVRGVCCMARVEKYSK